MRPETSVYADFNNMDPDGRLRLNVRGSFVDLRRPGDRVMPGLRIIAHDDDLEAEAVIEWSEAEAIWIGRLVSEIRPRQ